MAGRAPRKSDVCRAPPKWPKVNQVNGSVLYMQQSACFTSVACQSTQGPPQKRAPNVTAVKKKTGAEKQLEVVKKQLANKVKQEEKMRIQTDKQILAVKKLEAKIKAEKKQQNKQVPKQGAVKMERKIQIHETYYN